MTNDVFAKLAHDIEAATPQRKVLDGCKGFFLLKTPTSHTTTTTARLYLCTLFDEERTSRINAFLEKTETPLESAFREATRQTIKRSEW
jgi:hypothetical protein